MKKLNFGPAGIPNSCERRSSENGIKKVKELGLDSMEVQFVHGVRMKNDTAQTLRKVAEKNDIKLTAHGSYYINLNSDEQDKKEASIERVLNVARIGDILNAESVTFHPAYYGDDSKEDTFKVVKKAIKQILNTLEEEGKKIRVSPETTGKGSQFGSIDELIRLAKGIGDWNKLGICIDFSHLHARTGGEMNTEKEFRSVFEKVESKIGSHALKDMHFHVSGIEYTDKGEQNHLILERSDMNWKALLKVMKEFDVKGVLTCESPNLEVDAGKMREYYMEL